MSGSMTKRLRGWIAAGACAVSALGAGGAQAAVFVTNWDPLFNPTFPSAPFANLGWRGQGFIDVDPGCLVPSTTQTVGVGACLSGSFTGYNLFLYDTLPANVFAGAAGAGLFPALLQMTVDAGGVVSGIQMATPFQVMSGFTFFPTDVINVYDAELDYTTLGDPTLRITGVSGPLASGYVDTNSEPPVVTWRIPEPGPLALISVSLFGLLAMRRRRR